MYDVRAVANLVLDASFREQRPVTNMALNKIVFFMHCDYLVEEGNPLVEAKIEAWRHGPVFREIYHALKSYSDNFITKPIEWVNLSTGDMEPCILNTNFDETHKLTMLAKRYLPFTAAQLRAMSHREGGPWDYVWSHEAEANPGMRIKNDVITKLYTPEVIQ